MGSLFINRIRQFLLVGILDRYLLVAAPALGFGGQTCRMTLPGSRMAVQALHSEPQVQAVVELDRLVGRLLRQPDTICTLHSRRGR